MQLKIIHYNKFQNIKELQLVFTPVTCEYWKKDLWRTWNMDVSKIDACEMNT